MECKFRAKENINCIRNAKIKNNLKIKEITFLCDNLYEKHLQIMYHYVLQRLNETVEKEILI